MSAVFLKNKTFLLKTKHFCYAVHIFACMSYFMLYYTVEKEHMWDYTLLPQHGRGLCSSGMLCGIGW